MPEALRIPDGGQAPPRRRGRRPGEGGRKPGTRNRVPVEIRKAVEQAFTNVGGVAYLERLAMRDPKSFANLLGKVIPKEIHASIDAKIDMGSIIAEASERMRSLAMHDSAASYIDGGGPTLIEGTAERVDAGIDDLLD